MEEAVFFDVNRVLVSNPRFIVEGKTYSMNAVTSVRTARERPARSGPLAVLAIGLFCVLTGDANGIMLGVFALALGVLWWFKQKPTWRVLLTTSARETQALSSKDKDFIAQVVAALNESIVHRG